MSDSSDSEVEIRIPPLQLGDIEGDEVNSPRRHAVNQEVNTSQYAVYPDELRERKNDVQYLRLQVEDRAAGPSWPSTPVRDNYYTHNSRRPSLRPELYTGNEDWEEFICHFELCAELGRWSSRDKLLALAGSLKGVARTYYASLSSYDQESYGILMEKLDRRFGHTRQQSKWLSRLEGRKRAPGETISALGDDLRQMAQRAYPELNIEAQEVLALNQLYKSVSPEVKCRCMDKECYTISEAVDVIDRYEAIVGNDEERRKSAVRAVNSKPENSTENFQEDGEVQGKLQQLIQRIQRLEGSQERGRTKSCYQCGATDHFVRDCPQSTRSKTSQYRGRQPDQQY